MTDSIKPPDNVQAAWPLTSLTDLKDIPDNELTWLVDQLLPMNGTSMLVGPPKAGKSSLARNLAVQIAGGWGSWLGKQVKGGHVIHLCLDERMATVLTHYRKLIGDEPETSDFIHILTASYPRPKDLIEWLQSKLAEYHPALVIVDTLFRFTKIKDGNDYSQVVDALDRFTWLAENFDTHLMFIHHSNKKGIDGPRGNEILGSTGLAGSVDTIISLSVEGNQRQAYAYGRDDVDIEPLLLEMNDQGVIGVAGTKRAADEQDLRDEIIVHLHNERRGMTTEELRKDLKRDKVAITRAVNNAVDDGDLIVKKVGRKHIYEAALKSSVSVSPLSVQTETVHSTNLN